jgi:hypothetical protein
MLAPQAPSGTRLDLPARHCTTWRHDSVSGEAPMTPDVGTRFSIFARSPTTDFSVNGRDGGSNRQSWSWSMESPW